ncbi:MAG: methionyl-tRNA formyltransferase [Saprospiraceae bacterium]|nr:methionyl-tRNA formyltransferase [Saprospiraceae bacterium]
MKIIFFGTPDFAIPCAEIILKHHSLLAVVTAVDKPAGRGHQLNESAVKKWAIQQNVPILQPPNLKSEKFLEKLRKFNADAFVVVAFRMLPEIVWNMPPLGTYNIHASLLPDYRGAAPIQRAIMAGEEITGVTCFKLRHEIDEGDIVLQKVVPILPTDTGNSLHDKLSIFGAELLKESLDLIQRGNLAFISQSSHSTKFAAKIHPDDLIINWNQTCSQVYNFIRALSPYPTARTLYGNEQYKIYSTEFSNLSEPGEPGFWKIDFALRNFYIRCKDGWLRIIDLQVPSKKRMSASDFINGLKNK